MGGLWFAMPLIWSMLGITVARTTGRRPIEVVNAVEALVMKLAIGGGDEDGATDPRHRGRRNLPRAGWDFDALSKPGAYVTQPFRQSCTQPLMTLGLVEGTSARFNSFRLTHDGERLLTPLADICSKIETWVGGDKRKDWDILSAILPTASLPSAVRKELARRIYGDGPEAERRKAIREAGELLTSEYVLGKTPKGFAEEHLIDLRGGIATVRLRKSALRVLSAVEDRITKLRNDGLTPELGIAKAIEDDEIHARITACVAEAKWAEPHIGAAREVESLAFLSDCQTEDGLLQRLARRDRVVIVLRDDVLARGPAFGADALPSEDLTVAVSGVPELPRIANLLALTDDLTGSTAGYFIGKAAE